MDADRFDHLLRSLSTTPSRRHTLRVLAGSALGGLLGLELVTTTAKKGGKGGKKKCRAKGRVTICHKGKTITVSRCALKAHRRHGDKLGRCCEPQCAGRQCGPDGCGGMCGTCGTLPCTSEGICECLGQPNGTGCGDGRACSGGVCAKIPTCKRGAAPCDQSRECCSGACGGLPPLSCSYNQEPGDPCYDDIDCIGVGQAERCVGFVCAP